MSITQPVVQPVTQLIAQPVIGIMGPSLGPNLVINGEFVNGTTDWILGGSTAIFTPMPPAIKIERNNGTISFVSQEIPLEVGKQYLVTFNVYPGGFFFYDFELGQEQLVFEQPQDEGPQSFLHIAESSTELLKASSKGSLLGILIIGNISVKEVMGPIPPPSGPELVVNGTFDTDVSGWTPNTGSIVTWNATDQSLQSDITGPVGGAFQNVPLEIGKDYFFTHSVKLGTYVGAISCVQSAGFPGETHQANTMNQVTYTEFITVFTATGTTFRLSIQRGQGLTGIFYFDSMSVKEVL